MAYVVVELQTNSEGQTASIITGHETVEQAYSKYHAVLSAAAVSKVPYHAAVLLDRAGLELAQWCFEHEEE